MTSFLHRIVLSFFSFVYAALKLAFVSVVVATFLGANLYNYVLGRIQDILIRDKDLKELEWLSEHNGNP